MSVTETALLALENADDILVMVVPPYTSKGQKIGAQARILVSWCGAEYEFHRPETGSWHLASLHGEGCDAYGWVVQDPAAVHTLDVLAAQVS